MYTPSTIAEHKLETENYISDVRNRFRPNFDLIMT